MAVRGKGVAALRRRRWMMWTIDSEKKGKVVTGKRVLRADEFLAIRGSGELVQDGERVAVATVEAAKKKAGELVAAAKAEAKALKDSSQAAFEEEKRKGYEAGLAEGKKEMASQMLEMTAKNVRKFAHFEEAILNIVMRSLRRVIGEIDDTELIRRIVTNALQIVRNQKQAILKVNPDQAPAVRKSVAEWAKSGNQIELLEGVADGRLGKNACLIETEIGTVDASLDVQLTAIRRVLAKAFSLD